MPEAPPVMSTCLLAMVVIGVPLTSMPGTCLSGAQRRMLMTVAYCSWLEERRRVDGEQPLHRHGLRLGVLEHARRRRGGVRGPTP